MCKARTEERDKIQREKTQLEAALDAICSKMEAPGTFPLTLAPPPPPRGTHRRCKNPRSVPKSRPGPRVESGRSPGPHKRSTSAPWMTSGPS